MLILLGNSAAGVGNLHRILLTEHVVQIEDHFRASADLTALVSEMKTDADYKVGRIVSDVPMFFPSECKSKSDVR